MRFVPYFCIKIFEIDDVPVEPYIVDLMNDVNSIDITIIDILRE